MIDQSKVIVSEQHHPLLPGAERPQVYVDAGAAIPNNDLPQRNGAVVE